MGGEESWNQSVEWRPRPPGESHTSLEDFKSTCIIIIIIIIIIGLCFWLDHVGFRFVRTKQGSKGLLFFEFFFSLASTASSWLEPFQGKVGTRGSNNGPVSHLPLRVQLTDSWQASLPSSVGPPIESLGRTLPPPTTLQVTPNATPVPAKRWKKLSWNRFAYIGSSPTPWTMLPCPLCLVKRTTGSHSARPSPPIGTSQLPTQRDGTRRFHEEKGKPRD